MRWFKVMEEKNYAKRCANEYHLLRALFQGFAVYIMSYPILKLVYNIKREGTENIPKSGKCIYAGNHVSMFDPVLVSFAVGKPIVYMAKKELFEGGSLAWWIKRLGAFSVNREKPEIATFKTVKEVFKTAGWSLGIFPQGGIKENKKIEDIQKGFAVIAKHAQADIIPVSVIGFEGYSKKLFSQNVRVKIGRPISYSLPVEEIIYQWAKQICDDTGFENCMQEEIEPELEKIAV
ncbi:MAG: lysophospholipid acyltransferase family protein [Candidatus Gastranaerophilaceae bacterium]